jgi:hypothetical protein
MNGFSGTWHSENNGAGFPGFGFGFTDMDFIRGGQKRVKVQRIKFYL